MIPIYREIGPTDLPALFQVRTATRENRLTLKELEEAGITPTSVALMLGSTHSGWLCERDGQTVGFTIVNEAEGEVWVIAVLPAYEGGGIGSELLRRAQARLAQRGHQKIWLFTDPDRTLRAYRFYQAHGWREAGETPEGLRMERPLA